MKPIPLETMQRIINETTFFVSSRLRPSDKKLNTEFGVYQRKQQIKRAFNLDQNFAAQWNKWRQSMEQPSFTTQKFDSLRTTLTHPLFQEQCPGIKRDDNK